MAILCLFNNICSTLILLSDLENFREARKARFSRSDPSC